MSGRIRNGRPFGRDPDGSTGAADVGLVSSGEEPRTLVERIGMAPDDDIEFEPVRLDLFPRPVDLSD